MTKSFTDEAWADYQYWAKNDSDKRERINRLIDDIHRHPTMGIGKPEPLKGNLHGFWSRRIDQEHRVVYAIETENIAYISFRYHYK